MTIAQMSTTLATASLAFQYGIFDENIVAALVLLSIVTIIVTPLLTKLIFRYNKEKPTKFTKMWSGDEPEQAHKDQNIDTSSTN